MKRERPESHLRDALPDWMPTWLWRLGAPVWVCDPEQRIRLVDERAASVLGIEPRAGVGPPCYEIVRGADPGGRTFCRRACPVCEAVDSGESIAPFVLQRAVRGGTQWLQVLAVPLASPADGGHWVVHVAFDIDRAHRIEEYLMRVASRTPVAADPEALSELTAREAQILDCLAMDMDPQRVAVELNLAYATVRNHVQHILAKLGVHAIEEAIAVRLLAGRAKGRQ